MNGIARCRGVERVMLDVAEENPVYLALMEQRFNFHYEMYRRVLEAGERSDRCALPREKITAIRTA